MTKILANDGIDANGKSILEKAGFTVVTDKVAQDKLAEAPAWARKFAGPEVHEMMVQSLNNKIPVLIIGLVAVALCAYGALQMRKLKKEGYYLWLVGEVLPFIGSAIFIPAFFGTIFIWFAVFPAIFIILYTIQRKHLVN